MCLCPKRRLGRPATGILPIIQSTLNLAGKLLADVFCDDPINISRIERNIRVPDSKPAMPIDSTNPLSKGGSLRPILRAILPLRLQHQILTILKPDEEVRPIPQYDTLIEVEHLKPEMVVLSPCLYGRVPIKNEGLGGLPCAVVDAEVDL